MTGPNRRFEHWLQDCLYINQVNKLGDLAFIPTWFEWYRLNATPMQACSSNIDHAHSLILPLEYGKRMLNRYNSDYDKKPFPSEPGYEYGEP